MGTPTSRVALPAPEQPPALPMPADHRVGRDDRQVLAPAGTPSASQDPQELVPEAKPSMWSASSRTGEHRELVTQQQILEHEVLARAHPGQDCHEQQPDEFQHAFSIADQWRARGFAAPQPTLLLGRRPEGVPPNGAGMSTLAA